MKEDLEGSFFMLLMGAIANSSSLLDGPPDRRVLRHNTSAFHVKQQMHADTLAPTHPPPPTSPLPHTANNCTDIHIFVCVFRKSDIWMWEEWLRFPYSMVDLGRCSLHPLLWTISLVVSLQRNQMLMMFLMKGFKQKLGRYCLAWLDICLLDDAFLLVFC